MAKQSKQSRSNVAGKYQATIRAIKQRGDVSHKIAQQVYRSRRDAIGSGIPAARFTGYSKSYFRSLVNVARKTPQVTGRLAPLAPLPKLIRQETELFGGELSEQIAFDLQNLTEGTIVNERLEPFNVIQKMKVVIEGFVSGVSKGSKIITRELVPKTEFWRVYHSMVREALNDLYEEFGKEAPIAVVVLQITAL